MTQNILFYDVLNSQHRYVSEDDYIVPHLKAHELMCPDGRMIRAAPGFLEHLAVLRLDTDQPMAPSSCCRTIAHNENVGGNKNSAHLCDVITKHFTANNCGTCGIDLPGLQENDGFIKRAFQKGWSVGIANSFIHLDRIADYSPTHPCQRIFFYDGVPKMTVRTWKRYFKHYLGSMKAARSSV